MNNTPHGENPFSYHQEQTTVCETPTPKAKRKAITIQRVIDMCERDEYEGICLACGEDAFDVEPDARKYECDSCGKEKVYGCQELIMMLC